MKQNAKPRNHFTDSFRRLTMVSLCDTHGRATEQDLNGDKSCMKLWVPVAKQALLIIFGIALLLTAVSAVAIFTVQPQGGGHMGGMMGGFMPMMVWQSLLVLAGAAAVFSMIFYVFIPRTMVVSNPPPSVQLMQPPASMEAVLRVLKDDEQKVLQTIQHAGGSCLQKDITRQTGLSKLQTHRVVTRLQERGLLRTEKTGRTNRVFLAEWLRQGSGPPP